MKLILHIGTEKTGTTSIQTWLYANRAELSRQGICLSNLLDVPNNRALAHAFQDQVDPYFRAKGIDTHRLVWDFRDRLIRHFEEEISVAEKRHDQMVISSEHFQSRLFTEREVNRLAKVLQNLFSEVKVVCYIRHQAEMRRSLYSTLVRQGFTDALEDFDADIDESFPYYNHLDLAHRWETAFGRENILLREYLRDGDVVRDFLEKGLAGIDPIELSFPKTAENISLTSAHIAIYRLINTWLPYCDQRGRLDRGNARAKRLADMVLTMAPARGFSSAVSPQEREISKQILERFAESNRQVKMEFFQGDLFSDVCY